LQIFSLLTNELSSPRLLYCPDDKKRHAAGSFTNFTLRNISYFANLTLTEDRPQGFLAGDRNIETNSVPVSGKLVLSTSTPVGWSKEMHHEQGNIAMGDGSVQQMSSSRLKQAVRDHVEKAETLLFP
jgi:hypothetical protein